MDLEARIAELEQTVEEIGREHIALLTTLINLPDFDTQLLHDRYHETVTMANKVMQMKDWTEDPPE